MNQSYKIVWNESAQDWVVTSELASGKKKTKTTRASQVWQASLILAGVLTAANAQAGDIDVRPFTPTSDTIMITGNDNLVQGSGKGFAEWAENDKGFKSISIKDALAKGILTGGTEYANGFNIQQGNRSLATTVKDPVTGNNQTVNVYDNDAFLVTSLADFTFANHYDVGPEGQYVDKFIYEIAPSATLDVGVGETSASWVNTPANFVNIIMKSSSSDPKITSAVYKADDNSTLNYNGKTIVSLGNADNVGSTVPRTIASFQVPVGQTIESKIGTFTVTNVDELKVYNTALIKALQENRLSPADYESEFAKALKHGSISAIDSVSAGDPVTQTINKNQVAYIYASGPSSKVNIADTANIQLFRSDASLIRVENGADLTNAGTIGSFYNVISSGSDVIFAENASVHNTVTGVIDAGTNEEVAGFEYNGHDQSTTYQLGRVAGIEARDSDIVNDGVINVTSPQSYSQQYGIRATNSGNIINNGAINVASNTQVANVLGNNVGNFGVSLAGRDVSMVNNGTISVGRSAQRSLTDTSNDVAVNWAGIKAVSVAVGANFTNKGDIVTGALTHGVTAISVYNTGSVVNQEGTITINSAYAPAGKVPAQSIGIDVNTLVSEVDNSGTITLAGVNGVGLNVHAGAQATNSGTIAVANGIDSASKTANYGIQAEGKDARAILTGNVDLTGDGAIGVYARDGGSVNVDGGSINFLSGTKQLGLLIYGEGSSVASQNSIQDVSTQDSTLYRIDGGATYAANGASLTGSGAGSTILLSTGNGSDIDTKGMTLTASGDGATAVKVEGGAHATIDATTVINLTGNQSVAGSVKGGSTTIYGDAGAAGASVLDSSATLTSAGNVATGAMGYAVATGGTLNHHGTIDITAPGSTGVQINGGTMNNDAAITVDGTAVDIIGADSVVNNTDTITATDGTAAYRLSNGASLDLTGDGTTNAEGTAHGILLDTGAVGLTVKDATINMAATGTGNGIENRAEIDGIQLTNTTINVGNGAGVRTSASLAQTNSGTINVDGSGTGLLFQNADGSMADNAYDMSKSQELVINVNSAAGKGMTTNTTGAVKSGVSINVKDAAGGSALVVKGNSLSVAQSGTIQSASATQMVDINNGKTSTFTNSGTIASTAADGLVMDVDQQTVNFTNETGGSLAGAVNLQNGNNTVTLEHGSQAASVFTTGAGDDNYRLTGITADENATLFTTLDGGLGSDTLSLNNSVYTLSDAGKIQNIEHVNLANNSTFTLDKTQLDLSAADAGWNIDDSSTLAMNDDRALSFASHLAGSGLVTVDLGSKDNDFAFTANNAADGFAGTVALANSHFVLDGATTQNNQALSDATLKLGAGSVTDVAKGTQSIGGLAFDGGTIIFDTDTLGRDVSEALIQTAGNLDLSGTGTVQLRTNDVLNAPPVLPDHTLNLLAQDDANPVLQLATSTGTVSGSGANLLLEDKDGNAISQPTQADVLQNGITVANATYDFGLTDGENSDGLYVNYGLKILDLQTKGADALILTAAGETGAATDLSAQLTGSGDLAIDTGKDNTVSLSAIRNDYTGVTDVRSGTLRTDSDTVLGNTRELHQAAGTRVDLNGHAQTVGLLNTDATATTDFNGGSLAVTHGGIVNGTLTGAGELAVNGGTLTVNGANAAMTAATTIADGAEVALNDISGIGAGDILDNGLLTLNEGVQGVLGNNLTGSGNLQKNGSGLVSLTTASAQYAGTTDINGGGLQLGDSSTDVTLASSTVNVKEGAVFGGYGGTAGDVNNAGTLTLGDISPRLMALRAAGETQTFGIGQNLTNSGTINVSQPGSTTAGNILHVTGDYTGSGGTLNLNTHLGDDSSPTDKLVVDGSTHGTTTVAVNNVGGTGAATLNGIEVVSVGGTSDGEFSKKGRIVAGAYDYDLVKKGSNWYLTNNGATPVDPVDPVDPVNPVDPVDPVVPDDGGDTPDNGGNTPAPNVRPEGKAYASNLAAANNMFNMTLHDRLGETHYVDAFTGEKKVTSLWLRQVGGHNRSSDGSGQNKTQANRYIAQLGGDIGQWSSNGDDRFHLGVMGGYASQNSNTRNHVTGYSADGSVHGYSAGLYGTWFQDNEEKTGAYVDTWALYNWFDNGVSSKGQSSESYKSRGITASVESGYTWKMGEKNDHESYYIQPQAQLTWMGVKANDHKEANGTDVQFTGDGNVQTRLGVRAFIKGHSAKLDDGKERTFEPFVEANWLHNTHDFGANLDGVSVKQVGARNVGELKVGVEAKLNKTVNLWGNVGQQMGDKGYSDTQATVGFKMNF